MATFLSALRELTTVATSSSSSSSTPSSYALGYDGSTTRTTTNAAKQTLDDLLSQVRQSVAKEIREGTAVSPDDFEALYRTLTGGSTTLTYDDFLQHATTAPPHLRRFFTAQNYLMFPKDQRCGILVEPFLRFVQRTIDVETVSLQLVAHAAENSAQGFLNERELERFILDRIPEIGACVELPESFFPYYVFTASRRFLFFLDSRRTRRINIKKLAHSAVMEELLFLQRISQSPEQMESPAVATQVATNWFSGINALRVFSLYVDLDKDQNGMLSQEELLAFTGPVSNDQVQLTRTAVRRIFEENITYQPLEMDYKAFLDLYLALQYKATTEAMSYFWRVLDIDKCNRLTPAAIRYFYSDVHDSLRASGYDAPSVDNVCVEVYDILGVSSEPTFQELVASEQGHTVIGMLLDTRYVRRVSGGGRGGGLLKRKNADRPAHISLSLSCSPLLPLLSLPPPSAFWAYDNRESLMQQQNLSAVDVEQDSIDNAYDSYVYEDHPST